MPSTALLLPPTVAANCRHIVVDRVVSLVDLVGAVDAVGEALVVLRHARIVAFFEPDGCCVAVIVVAAGDELVVFDAHCWLLEGLVETFGVDPV